MHRRIATIVVSMDEIEDGFLGERGLMKSDEELIANLQLPTEIKILDHHRDFDTGEFKIRVEWDKLPEVVEGELIPYLDIVYKDGKPWRLQLYQRIVRTVFKGEIDLAS